MIHGFSATLKPNPFTGIHFKRWQRKTTMWLTTVYVFWVVGDPPEGMVTPVQDNAFKEATIVFVGAILSVFETD